MAEVSWMEKFLKSIWRISYRYPRLKNFLRALVGVLEFIGMLLDRLQIRKCQKTSGREKLTGKMEDSEDVSR